MRKAIIYMFLAVVLSGPYACSDKYEPYNYDIGGLNFVDSLVNYTFVYEPADFIMDTVWIKVFTTGFVDGTDRPVELQADPDGTDAVPDTHYVPFTEPTLRNYYVIKAGRADALLPVVVKRERSLKDTDRILKIIVKDNGLFGTGIKENTFTKLVITDQLAKPSHWNNIMAYYGLVGEYGREKHRFMVDATGENWDGKYFEEVLGYNDTEGYSNITNDNFDSGYISYMNSLLKRLLAERNERVGEMLAEADGTIVTFP